MAQHWYLSEDSVLHVKSLLDEDCRARQVVFKVNGLGMDMCGPEYEYILNDMTEHTSKDCSRERLAALCYAFLFGIGNTLYENAEGKLFLIDERPTKHATVLPEGVSKPAPEDVTEVISQIHSGLSTLLCFEQITYDEKCALMDRLLGAFKAEGIEEHVPERNTCCFCDADCSLNSQCCGTCSRILSRM